jgi:hypothetical protein
MLLSRCRLQEGDRADAAVVAALRLFLVSLPLAVLAGAATLLMLRAVLLGLLRPSAI